MKHAWVWGYVSMFTMALVLAGVGLRQSCPSVEDGFLITGCGDNLIASSVGEHALNWLLITGIVAIAGTVIALIMGRRPTLGSAAIWASAGLLEIAVPASWFTSTLLSVPILVAAGLAVLLAIPAGVALARPGRKSPDDAEVLLSQS